MVRQALNSLFTSDRFDICKVRALLEVVQRTDDSDAFRLLRTLHCVSYSSMDPALRAQIPQLVNEALRPQVVQCAATDVAMEGVVL